MSNHFMLEHLTKNRSSDKFRGFSYRKVLVDSKKTEHFKGVMTKVIAWGATYKGEKIEVFPNLKEVKEYIRQKVDG